MGSTILDQGSNLVVPPSKSYIAQRATRDYRAFATSFCFLGLDSDVFHLALEKILGEWLRQIDVGPWCLILD